MNDLHDREDLRERAVAVGARVASGEHADLDPGAIAAAELRYRRLFEEAPDGILILDPGSRRIVDCNPCFAELAGCRRAELAGRELREVGLFPDLDAWEATFGGLHAGGEARCTTLGLRTRAGAERHVGLVLRAYDEGGRRRIQCRVPGGAEPRRIAEALAAARSEIARCAAALEAAAVERAPVESRAGDGGLETVSPSLTHDLRAPLRAIRGYAALLLEEHACGLNPEGVHHLERINAAARLMSSLVDDALGQAGILAPGPAMRTIDLDGMVREIVRIHPELHAEGVEVEIPGPLATVWGNPAGLWRGLSNLLTNAVKFVVPGTRPRIRVRTEAEGSRVRIWVEDNGVGIAPEDQERIFRLFERVSGGGEVAGTGMGLAIVRETAERMGGSAGVESEPGVGSRFWIQLRKGAYS